MKIEEQILRRGDVKKKRHGHNFEFWAPKLNQRGTNMVVSTLIQFQAVILKIVAVSFFGDGFSPYNFSNTSSHKWQEKEMKSETSHM